MPQEERKLAYRQAQYLHRAQGDMGRIQNLGERHSKGKAASENIGQEKGPRVRVH